MINFQKSGRSGLISSRLFTLSREKLKCSSYWECQPMRIRTWNSVVMTLALLIFWPATLVTSHFKKGTTPNKRNLVPCLTLPNVAATQGLYSPASSKFKGSPNVRSLMTSNLGRLRSDVIETTRGHPHTYSCTIPVFDQIDSSARRGGF